MAQIEIYTTRICPFCIAAKKLLGEKQVSYDEIDVGNDIGLRDKMTARANGAHTVPQIFINNRHIGGCDDLYRLERDGALDALLQA
ncbi:MAG: glutaredoxin 3 [Parvibaculales bacterium]